MVAAHRIGRVVRQEHRARLGIIFKTAESHRNRMMKKLDIHQTAGLVRYAIRRGLLQL